mgnify:FL=1
MPRKRTLSDKGLELFNLLDEPIPPRFSKNCLKQFFLKIITTDFDIKIEQNTAHMKDSTKKLYQFLSINENKKYKLSDLMNNAIDNIIIFILTDGYSVLNKHQIKNNINYYINLAKNAQSHGDHHTTILVLSAIKSTPISRLKLKNTKSQIDFLNKCDKLYGDFINCHANHLKSILQGYRKHFYPSLMILDMHYNKTKEHAKAFKTIGKFPKTLLNVHTKLKYIITQYSKLSQDTNILPLYCIDPNSHTIFGQSIYITDNIKQKLYILSNIALKKFQK